MARSDPQLNFRIPAELREQLDAAARDNNRSLTGELIARLQSTFDGVPSFPFAVEQAIEHEQEERGGTREEALTRLVLAGQAKGGTVFQVVVPRAMTMQEYRELMRASETVIPPDANMILERR